MNQDTADFYSNGASEVIVGKALKKYNISRNKVTILSKVYFPITEGEGIRVAPINDGAIVNQMGLSRKHIFDAVDGCLRRLDMDYIGKCSVVPGVLCVGVASDNCQVVGSRMLAGSLGSPPLLSLSPLLVMVMVMVLCVLYPQMLPIRLRPMAFQKQKAVQATRVYSKWISGVPPRRPMR